MGVSLHTNHLSEEVGSSSFFHCFFSTIAVNLEPEGWGTRFPTLMNKLYKGRIAAEDAPALVAELDAVESAFLQLPVSKVVWDTEDRAKLPPWGDHISPHINSLGNYFVTSNGRNLFDVLRECAKDLKEVGGELRIE